MDPSSNSSYNYNEESNVWLEPLSVILNCMLPVEYIYAEWFKWVVKNEVLRSDPEYISSRGVREIETGSQTEGFCLPEFRVSHNTDHVPRYENRDFEFYSLATPDFENTAHWIPDHDAMTLSESVFYDDNNQLAEVFNEVVHSPDDPRYLRLKITDDWKKFRPTFKDANFLHHSILFPGKYNKDELFQRHFSSNESVSWTYDAHGPVRKLESTGDWTKFEEDETLVFKYPHAWPEPAMEWLVRQRSGSWPSPDLIQEIVESGCHIAPVGRGTRENEPLPLLDYLRDPTQLDVAKSVDIMDTVVNAVDCNACGDTASNTFKDSPIMDETEWRLSFSVAENRLAQSVTPVQRHIMILLKMIKKMYFPEVGISTYLLKNLMFWEIEKQDESFWSEDNSANCLLHMLDQLQKTLEKGFLPQYLMPKSNLLNDEDPRKLANAVGLICEVRKAILPKLITMFKRCCSLPFHSPTFHRQMYFEPFLENLQDKTLSDGEVQELVFSLLNLFISRCRDCIESMHRIHERDDASEGDKRSIRITINVYESMIARCLTKSWFLKISMCKNIEEFANFVKHESSTFPSNDTVIQLALVFLQQASEGKNLSDLVPTTQAMENIKDTYRTGEQFSLNQGKASSNLLAGDLFDAMKVIQEGRLKDVKVQDVKFEELQAKFNQLLLLKALGRMRENEQPNKEQAALYESSDKA